MDVTVTANGVDLPGLADQPDNPIGWVVFAHGSGSGRLSPRNQRVAAALRGVGAATLLFDLLTQEEDRRDQMTAEHRFDIGLLSSRLTGVVDWLVGSGGMPGAAALPVGLFGASTGAAAALITAADRPDVVGAVVSRGGRPDLAGDALPRVAAPTLLIVGSRDEQVLDLNRAAAARLTAPNEIAIVQGAGHLFEEPGALDEVSRLAGEWFARHFAA